MHQLSLLSVCTVDGASLGDEALYDRAKAEDGELFPAEIANRLLVGESPVGVYRKYRGMTRTQLAEAAGIDPVYLSQIETGTQAGSPRILAVIARALQVDPGDFFRNPSMVSTPAPSLR